MGKVQYIEKCRKKRMCGKCRSIIQVRDSYYKGVLNFHPDIIRCIQCGLQPWEVTTSDYQLNVGAIVYEWHENFGVHENAIEEIKGNLEEIMDDVQERLDNMPESLQDAPTGEILKERIGNLEECIDELDAIDIDMIKESAVEDCEYFEGSDRDYDAILTDDSVSEIEKSELRDEFETQLSSVVDEILSNLGI